MAKNILQGVAMYANNNSEKADNYKTQSNNADTSAPDEPASLKNQREPLYVINGKVVDKLFFDKRTKDTDNILSMNVLKGSDAINKYGNKGKNGAIEIVFKSNKVPNPPPPIRPTKVPQPPPPLIKRDTVSSRHNS